MQTSYKQSVNRYRLLFENVIDAIYLTTEDGRFLFFNEATCLLSGYSHDELKGMTVSQLQVDEEPIEDHRRAWLDNGICRYEERWKTKSGKTLHLEVNSKWIKLSKKQFILHISRDIQRRMEVIDDRKVRDVARFQEDKFRSMAAGQQALFRRIIGPLTNTVGFLQTLAKKHPSEEIHTKPILSEWERVRPSIQHFQAKAARDLLSGETEWNLNDILHQELHFLQVFAEGQQIVCNTNFAPQLPALRGNGRQYSIVFGGLFLALLKSMGSIRKKEMTVVTEDVDNTLFVAVQAEHASRLENHLAAVLDPGVNEQDPESASKGILAMQILLKPIRGTLEIEYPPGKGVIAKIKLAPTK